MGFSRCVSSKEGSFVVSFSLLISLLCPIDLNSISTAVLSRNVEMYVLPCPQFPERKPSPSGSSLWAGPLCAPMQGSLTWKVSCSSRHGSWTWNPPHPLALPLFLTLVTRRSVSASLGARLVGSKEDSSFTPTGQAALPLPLPLFLSSVALASETH